MTSKKRKLQSDEDAENTDEDEDQHEQKAAKKPKQSSTKSSTTKSTVTTEKKTEQEWVQHALNDIEDQKKKFENARRSLMMDDEIDTRPKAFWPTSSSLSSSSSSSSSSLSSETTEKKQPNQKDKTKEMPLAAIGNPARLPAKRGQVPHRLVDQLLSPEQKNLRLPTARPEKELAAPPITEAVDVEMPDAQNDVTTTGSDGNDPDDPDDPIQEAKEPKEQQEKDPLPNNQENNQNENKEQKTKQKQADKPLNPRHMLPNAYRHRMKKAEEVRLKADFFGMAMNRWMNELLYPPGFTLIADNLHEAFPVHVHDLTPSMTAELVDANMAKVIRWLKLVGPAQRRELHCGPPRQLQWKFCTERFSATIHLVIEPCSIYPKHIAHSVLAEEQKWQELYRLMDDRLTRLELQMTQVKKAKSPSAIGNAELLRRYITKFGIDSLLGKTKNQIEDLFQLKFATYTFNRQLRANGLKQVWNAQRGEDIIMLDAKRMPDLMATHLQERAPPFGGFVRMMQASSSSSSSSIASTTFVPSSSSFSPSSSSSSMFLDSDFA